MMKKEINRLKIHFKKFELTTETNTFLTKFITLKTVIVLKF